MLLFFLIIWATRKLFQNFWSHFSATFLLLIFFSASTFGVDFFVADNSFHSYFLFDWICVESFGIRHRTAIRMAIEMRYMCACCHTESPIEMPKE